MEKRPLTAEEFIGPLSRTYMLDKSEQTAIEDWTQAWTGDADRDKKDEKEDDAGGGKDKGKKGKKK